MSRDLVRSAFDGILDRVIDGSFPAGSALPPEADLAALLDVSRPTMREAVRVLTDRGVLKVVHGRGTYVLPRSDWTDLNTIIQAMAATTPPQELGLQLTEVRRMIEVGACGLAAKNRSDDDVERMRAILEDYDAAAEDGDVEAAVEADIAFHELIMNASGNPFIPSMMQPLETALRKSRRTTTEHGRIRSRAQAHHYGILEAIAAQDVAGAKTAMRAHMTQTREDIEGI